MITVEQLIADLLLQNNCVIIPSFGGFVAQRVAAKIDFESGKIAPPKKSLLFNKQLINNDGLLINELAKQNQSTFNEATNQVSSVVSEWNQSLKAGERVELDKIGFLYNDSENNLCFEQDRFFNLLLESFGLGQVNFLTEEDVQLNEQRIELIKEEPIFVPIISTEIAPIEIEEKETVIIEHPATDKKRIKVWKLAAAACILPIAFYSIWIPMKTDVLQSGIISFNDFNPFHKQVEQKYSPQSIENSFSIIDESSSTIAEVIETLPEEVGIYTYKYSEDLFIPVKINDAENATVSNSRSNVETFSANAMNYVVGCFGKKSNATSLVEKLNAAGLDARIIDVKNGLHRVSAGTAISLEELSNIKATSKSLGFKGWTLK
ncbi:MAG TPA: SPOR domain-containing protein [Crocinitomicaceae bacterium]|nr:SPOR domain-containing protein [Crocinitomicaceae bacterium]